MPEIIEHTEELLLPWLQPALTVPPPAVPRRIRRRSRLAGLRRLTRNADVKVAAVLAVAALVSAVVMGPFGIFVGAWLITQAGMALTPPVWAVQ